MIMSEDEPIMTHSRESSEDRDSGIGDIGSPLESDNDSVTSEAGNLVEENNRVFRLTGLAVNIFFQTMKRNKSDCTSSI